MLSDRQKCLAQHFLKLRSGQDRLRQGILAGFPLVLPERQFQELGHGGPLNLLADGGLEQQLSGAEILCGSPGTDRLGTGCRKPRC